MAGTRVLRGTTIIRANLIENVIGVRENENYTAVKTASFQLFPITLTLKRRYSEYRSIEAEIKK